VRSEYDSLVIASNPSSSNYPQQGVSYYDLDDDTGGDPYYTLSFPVCSQVQTSFFDCMNGNVGANFQSAYSLSQGQGFSCFGLIINCYNEAFGTNVQGNLVPQALAEYLVTNMPGVRVADPYGNTIVSGTTSISYFRQQLIQSDIGNMNMQSSAICDSECQSQMSMGSYSGTCRSSCEGGEYGISSSATQYCPLAKTCCCNQNP